MESSRNPFKTPRLIITSLLFVCLQSHLHAFQSPQNWLPIIHDSVQKLIHPKPPTSEVAPLSVYQETTPMPLRFEKQKFHINRTKIVALPFEVEPMEEKPDPMDNKVDNIVDLLMNPPPITEPEPPVETVEAEPAAPPLPPVVQINVGSEATSLNGGIENFVSTDDIIIYFEEQIRENKDEVQSLGIPLEVDSTQTFSETSEETPAEAPITPNAAETETTPEQTTPTP